MTPTTRKVVLYNPSADHWTMPLALLALASSLDRDLFDPVIVDGRLLEDPVEEVLGQCEGALCLGCTVLSGAPIGDALKVSREAKKRYPDLPVIWGGWHPSLLPESCLEEEAIDIAVSGQGEPVLREIVDHLLSGTTVDECAGCTLRGPNGEVRRNPPLPLTNLGTLPPLDYELIDVEQYFQLKKRRQLDYVSSIGCRYRCGFCADPTVYGRRWVGLEPERIGEDVDALWHRWRFDDLSFQDETFFTDSSRVAATATQFLEREFSFSWAATMRADQGARLSDDVFSLCKESGLRRVMVGVEAATQEGLDSLRKDITLEQVELTAERCVRHGLAAIFSFIVGFPGEEMSSVVAAIHLAAKLRAVSPHFETPFFYYHPYPGSELEVDALIGYDGETSSLQDWVKFDFVGTAGSWVPETVRQLVDPLTLESAR